MPGYRRPYALAVGTEFDFRGADGTVVRGWRDDETTADAVPLLLSNGLGTIPQAWPGLVRPGSGYRTVTWFHRGTFGSQRPADPTRVRIEDHVDDAVALLDAAGVDRALVACWSIGVNIGFELAARHPDRVAGLLAVAGVPGGTFATMGAPLRVPRRLRHPLATGVAKAARTAGPALTWLAHHVPVTSLTAQLVRHSGVILPIAPTDVVEPMLREFLRQDWRWYFTLAVAAAEHPQMDLSFLRCPVTLVAGQHDVLTSMQDMVETAQQIPHAEVTVLPGTHFLPMEYPELVLQALDELADRSDL